MTIDLNERPNQIPWPPILLVGVVAFALLLHWIVPTGSFIASVPESWRPVGAAVAIAGVFWDIWAMVTMAQARTNILPHRAAGHLISSGPFAISRNPIYLGNTVLLAGLALALDNLWFLISAMDFAVLVYVFAIKREEAHMALRFGEEWRAYAARVPRWVGPF